MFNDVLQSLHANHGFFRTGKMKKYTVDHSNSVQFSHCSDKQDDVGYYKSVFTITCGNTCNT